MSLSSEYIRTEIVPLNILSPSKFESTRKILEILLSKIECSDSYEVPFASDCTNYITPILYVSRKQ